MDSGFLSGSSVPEVPKAPEQAPSASPELAPSVPIIGTEPAFQEAQLESEFVQTQATVGITAREPVADVQTGAVPVTADAITTPPDKVAEDVQKILEEGIEEAIVSMPEEAKKRFLQKGKEIGTILSDMVRQYKVEVKRVLHLLKEWLIAIPGVNKFFLEQEAKIKTDRILELERVRHSVAPT